MSYYTGTTRPDYSDNEETLLKKIAQSYYLLYGEVSTGATGPTRPTNEDNRETLTRKIAQVLYNNA